MSGDAFARHRSLLFTVAYEMLGSASDAEDVVPETWLRWADVDHGAVRDPRAYLVRIVTRQALNRLRTLARRREDYVGEWLPEPLVTSPDVAADVELAPIGRWSASRVCGRSCYSRRSSGCSPRPYSSSARSGS
jgi:DNA-directed RNA polymerase specialized sigma24 family protein